MSDEVPAKAIVLDAAGRRLSPCPVERARKLLAAGKAALVSEDPLTIRLCREVELPPPPEEPLPPGRDKRILLHVCCGPCGTYPASHLREQEFAVTAFWYNPNIYPFDEHERRREALLQFARAEDLPVLEWSGHAVGTTPEPHWHHEMDAFLQAVVGHEAFGQRCRICYRIRLQRTAQVAQEQGFDTFSTTLLISPYQDEEMIRTIGQEVGQQAGVPFYYDRFRRGWSERGRLAEAHQLYRQDYCGCIYSKRERQKKVGTNRRVPWKTSC